MTILRVTLSAWPDLGAQVSAGMPVGTAILPAYLKIIPTFRNGVVRDTIGVVHGRSKEETTITEFPFSYDLVDPIGTMPENWGYTIELSSKTGEKVYANLTADVLSAITVVDNFRIVVLEDHLGVATTDPASPWIAPAEWLRLEALASASADASAASKLAAATSAASAASSADSASSSATIATEQKDLATTEANRSVAASGAASFSATSALNSANAADADRIAAEAAKLSAQAAEESAAISETSAIQAAVASIAARDISVSAKDTSVAAKDDAVIAKTAAETAQGLAQTAATTAVEKAGTAVLAQQEVSANLAGMVEDAEIVGEDLVFTKHDLSTFNAGRVVGEPGEPGPAWSAEIRSANSSDNLYNYIGKAVDGSLEAAAVWTITRITLTDPVGVKTTATNVAWTDRETAVYS